MKLKSESEVAQLCPTLCNPMECSLLGSSIHGIFQTRVLEWGASAFFRYTEGPFSCHQDGRASGAVLESWAELTFLGEPQVGEPHVAFHGLVLGTQTHNWNLWGEGTPIRCCVHM